MTPEEAGEIVLQNDPWEACVRCKRTGYIPRDYVEIGDALHLTEGGSLTTLSKCESCGGAGHFLKPEYRRACERIGRPLPNRFALISAPVGRVIDKPKEGEFTADWFDAPDGCKMRCVFKMKTDKPG